MNNVLNRFIDKSRRTFYCLLFFGSFAATSCGPKIKPLPKTKSTQVTIRNFFSNCVNPTSSSNIITYFVNFKVWYGSGNNMDILEDKNYNSPTTQPRNEMVITTQIPSDGTYYRFEITIFGEQCARCALTQNCIQQPNGNSYSAAFPRAYFKGGVASQYLNAYTISDFVQIENRPNTCGCLVPNN